MNEKNSLIDIIILNKEDAAERVKELCSTKSDGKSIIGSTDTLRLRLILGELDMKGFAPLADLLPKVFQKESPKASNDDFIKFKSRVNKKAQNNYISFAIEINQNEISDPEMICFMCKQHAKNTNIYLSKKHTAFPTETLPDFYNNNLMIQ